MYPTSKLFKKKQIVKHSAAAEGFQGFVTHFPFQFFPCAILAICKKDEQYAINQNRTYGKGYKAKFLLQQHPTVAKVIISMAKATQKTKKMSLHESCLYDTNGFSSTLSSRMKRMFELYIT